MMTMMGLYGPSGLVNLCSRRGGRGEFRCLLLHALVGGFMLLKALRFQGVSYERPAVWIFQDLSLDNLTDVGTDMNPRGLSKGFRALNEKRFADCDCEEVFLELSDHGLQ